MTSYNMYSSGSFISITMYLRCIHVVRSWFIFSVVQHSVVWIHYNLLVLPMDLLIMWSLFFSPWMMLWTCIYVLVQCTKVSLGYKCLWVEFYGCRICACLTLPGNTNLFSETLLTNQTAFYSTCIFLSVHILTNT